MSDRDPHSIFLRLLAEKADEELKRYELAINGGLQPKALRPKQMPGEPEKGTNQQPVGNAT